MTNIDDIISAAQSLPLDDRAKLIPLLWDKLNPDEWPIPTEAWVQEASRRSDEVDSGNMQADTWENVRERARKKAGLGE